MFMQMETAFDLLYVFTYKPLTQLLIKLSVVSYFSEKKHYLLDGKKYKAIVTMYKRHKIINIYI